jgi:hypothetical protein
LYPNSRYSVDIEKRRTKHPTEEMALNLAVDNSSFEEVILEDIPPRDDLTERDIAKAARTIQLAGFESNMESLERVAEENNLPNYKDYFGRIASKMREQWNRDESTSSDSGTSIDEERMTLLQTRIEANDIRIRLIHDTLKKLRNHLKTNVEKATKALDPRRPQYTRMYGPPPKYTETEDITSSECLQCQTGCVQLEPEEHQRVILTMYTTDSQEDAATGDQMVLKRTYHYPDMGKSKYEKPYWTDKQGFIWPRIRMMVNAVKRRRFLQELSPELEVRIKPLSVSWTNKNNFTETISGHELRSDRPCPGKLEPRHVLNETGLGTSTRTADGEIFIHVKIIATKVPRNKVYIEQRSWVPDEYRRGSRYAPDGSDDELMNNTIVVDHGFQPFTQLQACPQPIQIRPKRPAPTYNQAPPGPIQASAPPMPVRTVQPFPGFQRMPSCEPYSSLGQETSMPTFEPYRY